MELRQLNYFLAITESENMSDASRKLHVSQPAMSAALKDLEHELGFSLFDRVGRRLVINENGRYFAARARSIFAILKDAQETVQSSIDQRSRTVNIRVNMPLGRLGRDLFADFTKENPDFAVRIGFPTSELFGTDLAAIDLEIVGSYRELEPSSRVIKIREEDFAVALPPSHSLKDAPSVRLRDLASDPFVLGEPSVMRDIVDTMFVEAGFTPRIVGELQLFSDILEMVRAGMGCAIVASYTWVGDHEEGLVVKPLEDVQRTRFIYARVPADREPSAATWEFLSYLRHNQIACDR